MNEKMFITQKSLIFLIIALLSLSLVFAAEYGGSGYGDGTYGTGVDATSSSSSGGGGGDTTTSARTTSTSTFSTSATVDVPENTNVQNSVSDTEVSFTGCTNPPCSVTAGEVASTSLPSDANNFVLNNNGEVIGAVQYTCTGSPSGGSVSYTASGVTCATLRTTVVHSDGTVADAPVTSCTDTSSGVSATSSVGGCSYLLVWKSLVAQSLEPEVSEGITGEVVAEPVNEGISEGQLPPYSKILISPRVKSALTLVVAFIIAMLVIHYAISRGVRGVPKKIKKMERE